MFSHIPTTNVFKRLYKDFEARKEVQERIQNENFPPEIEPEMSLQELEEEIRILEEKSGCLGADRPLDLLDLNVLERNKYWERKKEEKIMEQRLNIIEKELDGCTFKPKLNRLAPPPRYHQQSYSNSTQLNSRPASACRNYSQKYKNKARRVPTDRNRYAAIHRRNTSFNK